MDEENAGNSRDCSSYLLAQLSPFFEIINKMDDLRIQHKKENESLQTEIKDLKDTLLAREKSHSNLNICHDFSCCYLTLNTK